MPNNKIYLGNLSKTVTDSLLKAHFAEYGEITEVHLPLDGKSKETKGYAFITFALESSAENALEQDGQSFLDQEISVQIATEKRRKK
jgi:RNA recognition motif-containing protein